MIETYLNEVKWDLLNLEKDINFQESENRYKEALSVYFYFLGEVSNPLVHLQKKGELIKALEKRLPNYRNYLFDNRIFNPDPSQYRHIKNSEKWREIYKIVTRWQLKALYYSWENKPVQQSLFQE